MTRAPRRPSQGPRLAILSDIHGNLPALEAVIEDLEAQGVDEVLVGGDLVGRGPQGRAVVERIRALGWPSVRGNHEDYLLAFRRGEVPAAWLTEERAEWAASRWMAAELDAEAERYIDSLPFSMTSRLVPQVRLVHGSPRSNNEGLGPWSSEEELAGQLGRIEERVLVCAHTHRPLDRRFPDGLVVNVGSVGLPFNRDRRAQYLILEAPGDDWRRWTLEPRQVPYDLEETLEVYERSGFLARGGITARLLRLELEGAVPYLVPFLEWASARGERPAEAALERFLGSYDPTAPLREFFERLEAEHPPAGGGR